MRERFNGARKAFYETASLDRQLISKMISYEGYTPSKETAIAIALAARLTLLEAQDFLSISGYALSDSLPVDIVHAACFRNQDLRAGTGAGAAGRVRGRKSLNR